MPRLAAPPQDVLEHLQLVHAVDVELLVGEAERLAGAGGREVLEEHGGGRAHHHRAGDEVAHAQPVPVEERQEPEHQHPGRRREARPAGRAREDRLGREERRHGQEELELAREVPRDDGLRGEGAAPGLHRADPQPALAGGLPLPGELEEGEVEGAHQEDGEDHDGHHEVAFQEPTHHEHDERDEDGEHDDGDGEQVEQERAEPVSRERHGEAHGDALGGHHLSHALGPGLAHGRSLPLVPR